MQPSPEDAYEQARSMLQDLQDAKTTSQRERAMGHFERYIAKHKPEFYDDDVRQQAMSKRLDGAALR